MAKSSLSFSSPLQHITFPKIITLQFSQLFRSRNFGIDLFFQGTPHQNRRQKNFQKIPHSSTLSELRKQKGLT